MKTQSVLFLALATALLVAAAPLQAQTKDPLWTKALAQVETTKSLVASEVQMQMEVTDSDGKVQDRVDKKSRLTGWKDGEPVRVQTSSEASKKSEANDSNFDLALANRPDQVLSGITSAQRQAAETTLDGRPSVIFQVIGEVLKKDKKLPFTGKVWVDKDTASVLKLDYVFDPSQVPMTKKMSQSIVFGAGKDGAWLPKTSVIDATISAVFVKANVAMRFAFESWVTRP
jgi:hypothetical protein